MLQADTPNPGDGTCSAIYEAKSVSIRYGGVLALDEVSLSIRPGEVHGLIGANGAGKSSLVKILAGVQRPDSGELVLDGRRVTFADGRAAMNAGIATVSQELNLFPHLTVLENLFLMREPLRAGALTNRTEMRSRVQGTLDAVGLPKGLLDRPLYSLGLGARQRVEIARALLDNPRVLMLDEPTSALNATETRRLLGVIAEMRTKDVGIVLVSHFLDDVLESADVLTVLRGGVTVERGVPSEKYTAPSLVEKMLGPAVAVQINGARTHRLPVGARSGTGPLILREVQLEGTLQPLSMTVRPGEVVGVGGLDGSGAAEILRMIFGQLRPSGGQITLPNGKPGPKNITQAVRSGVAFVPADRKAVGLHLDAPVFENVCMVTSGPLRRAGTFPRARTKVQRSEAWCEALGIVTSSPRAVTATLSGGNQQKVVFAKWLETAPDLVLLEEPTRGVDVGAKADMMGIIRQMARSGQVVVYTSNDLAEMAQTCDRVLVFYRGRLVGEMRQPLDEHGLLTAITTGVVPTSHRSSPTEIGDESEPARPAQ